MSVVAFSASLPFLKQQRESGTVTRVGLRTSCVDEGENVLKEVFEGKDFFLQKNTFFEFDSVCLNNERTRNSCSTKAIGKFIFCALSSPVPSHPTNLGLRVLFSTAIQHTVNTPFPDKLIPLRFTSALFDLI